MGIHPGERVTLLAARQQAVLRIHPDVVSGPANVPVDDALQRVQPVRDKSPVTADREVSRERVKHPEGRVHRVVLRWLPAVGKAIRNQAPVQVTDVGVEDGTRLPEHAGPDGQPGQADHGIASPVREPVISGDHGAIRTAGWRTRRPARNPKVLGRPDQLARKGVVRPGILQHDLLLQGRLQRPGRVPAGRDRFGAGDEDDLGTWAQ